MSVCKAADLLILIQLWMKKVDRERTLGEMRKRPTMNNAWQVVSGVSSRPMHTVRHFCIFLFFQNKRRTQNGIVTMVLFPNCVKLFKVSSKCIPNRWGKNRTLLKLWCAVACAWILLRGDLELISGLLTQAMRCFAVGRLLGFAFVSAKNVHPGDKEAFVQRFSGMGFGGPQGRVKTNGNLVNALPLRVYINATSSLWPLYGASYLCARRFAVFIAAWGEMFVSVQWFLSCFLTPREASNVIQFWLICPDLAFLFPPSNLQSTASDFGSAFYAEKAPQKLGCVL